MATRSNRPHPSGGPAGEFIHFSVDAALLKELGERLVGKPHVALAELVKNAYDADATKVRITIEPDFIEVVDNGDGMTRADFRKFWMRVGTTHKQDLPMTPVFGRTVSGSKGVGRLSVQFLGNYLEMWSVPRDSVGTALRAVVDWREAQQAGNLVESGATLYRSTPTSALVADFGHGTRLRIEGLNQVWGPEELAGLALELWFLRPPAALTGDLIERDAFDIELVGPSEEERKAFDESLNRAFSNWTAQLTGKLKGGRAGANAELKIAFSDGEIKTASYQLENKVLDQASFTIRIYKLTGKQPGGISVKTAREYFQKFGGAHVYDQTFRLPFYGGQGEDWLRLEMDHSHRLMISKLVPGDLRGDGDLRDLPTNSRIFGVVRVSTSHERRAAPLADRAAGAYLNVQVTRDRFIDNAAMTDLRSFVRWGLDYYAYLASAKKYRRDGGTPKPIPPTDSVFDEIRSNLIELKATVPPPAVAQLERVETQVEQLVNIEQLREKRNQRERILLGALATAGTGAIALEHELGKELTALRLALDELTLVESSTESTAVRKSLEALIARIVDTRKLFSPLMEPENRDHVDRMKAKAIVDGIVGDLKPLLRGVRVDTSEIDESLRLPLATRAAWAAILQNVIVNAINATIDTARKRIRVFGARSADRPSARLIVEDNGIGVDLDDAEVLFEPFERRMELASDRKRLGLGGVGLGLTIVRMIAESVDCRVEFVEPSHGMSTAVEITWKVPKDDEATPRTHSRRRH